MALELEVTQEGRLQERYRFAGQEAEQVVIGRHESCDVILEDVEGISRRHCEVVAIPGGGHVLRDLGSSNGTFVRGRKIKTHALNDGDDFSLCSLTIRYRSQDEHQLPEPEPELGIPVPDMTFKVDVSHAAQKVRTSRFSRLKGYLLVGTGARERNYVLHGSLVVIGSDPNADITLQERAAPRVTALIVREDTCFRVLDVSPKGKWLKVNGALQQDVVLQRGDDLELGEQKLRFFSGLPKLRPKRRDEEDEGTKRWRFKR